MAELFRARQPQDPAWWRPLRQLAGQLAFAQARLCGWWSLATLALGTACGLACAAWPQLAAARATGELMAAALLLLAGAAAARVAAARSRTPAHLAVGVAKALPAHRSALYTALQPPPAEASPLTLALAARHAERLAPQLQQAAIAGAVRRHTAAGRRRARLLATATSLGAIALAVALPAARSRLRQLWRGQAVVEQAAEPSCFDFTVRVDYPAYTHWPSWTQTGATGDVRALAGSTVHLAAQPAFAPRKAAWLVWPAEDGERRGAADVCRPPAVAQAVGAFALAGKNLNAVARVGAEAETETETETETEPRADTGRGTRTGSRFGHRERQKASANRGSDLRHAPQRARRAALASVQLLPANLGTGRVEGSFAATTSLCYVAVLQDAHDIWQVDGVAHRITAVPDAPPTAELLAPQTEVTLAAEAALPVVWRAQDDVGVTVAELVLAHDGNVLATRPLALKGGSRRAAGRTQLRLSDWPELASLADEDDLVLQLALRIHDNAPAPGPHVSTSPTVNVRRPSAAAHHRKNLRRLAAAQDTLVDWLAAEWQVGLPTRAATDAPATDAPAKAGTTPTSVTTLQSAVATAAATFESLADALFHDRRAEPALRNVVRQVASHAEAVRQQGIDRADGERRYRLEQDLLYLDTFAQHAANSEVAGDAKAAGKRAKALQDVLAGAADRADAGHRQQQAQQLLAQLRSDVERLMARVSARKQALPQAYANEEAGGSDKWEQTLARIERHLVTGDDAAAREELGHLSQMVAEMDAQLAEEDKAAVPPAFAKQQAALQALAQQVEALHRDQLALVQAAQVARREEMHKALGRDVEVVRTADAAELVALTEQLAALERQGKLLAEVGPEWIVLRRAVDALQVLQQQRRDGPALAQAERALAALAALSDQRQQHLGGLPQDAVLRRQSAAAQKTLQRQADHLRLWHDDNRPPPGQPVQAARLRAFGLQQTKLRGRATAASATLRDLVLRLPMLGELGVQLLDRAAAAMGTGAQAFGRQQLGDGTRAADAAAQALAEFLAAAAAQAKAAASGGMPLPMDAPTDGEQGGPGGDAAGTGDADDPGGDGQRASGKGQAGGQAAGRADGTKGGGDSFGAGQGAAGPANGGDGQQAGDGRAPVHRDAAAGGSPDVGQDVDLSQGQRGQDPAFRRALERAAQTPPPPRYAPAVRRYYDELLQ